MQVTHIQKRKKIISLSIVYAILFFSIVLAFPALTGSQWSSAQEDNTVTNKLYSAPNSIINNLPVVFINGATQIGNNTTTETSYTNPTPQTSPTNTTITTNQQKINKKPAIIKANTSTSTSTITCTTLWVCEKIRFIDGYTTKQKTQYYTSILQVLHWLKTALPDIKKLTDTLFSITLSPIAWERRWWWWSKTITIHTKDIVSVQEFREIFTHELWHIVDLWVIKWSQSSMNNNFLLWDSAQFSIDDPSLEFYTISWDSHSTRKANASYMDFVWWYAMSSPYEDFAESFNAFLWHNEAFKTMAKSSTTLAKKYIYMHKLLQWFSFAEDTKNKSKIIQQPWRRPWDTTRMSSE